MAVVDVATCSYQEFKPEMGVPVRISIGVPKYEIPWLDPRRSIWIVTPRTSYLRASDAVYEREFRRQLDMAGVKKLLSIFEQVSEEAGGGRLVLLCFEKLGAKNHKPRPGLSQMESESLVCHRRLFAQWWFEQTGEEIPELGSRLDCTPKADAPNDEPTLF